MNILIDFEITIKTGKTIQNLERFGIHFVANKWCSKSAGGCDRRDWNGPSTNYLGHPGGWSLACGWSGASLGKLRDQAGAPWGVVRLVVPDRTLEVTSEGMAPNGLHERPHCRSLSCGLELVSKMMDVNPEIQASFYTHTTCTIYLSCQRDQHKEAVTSSLHVR